MYVGGVVVALGEEVEKGGEPQEVGKGGEPHLPERSSASLALEPVPLHLESLLHLELEIRVLLNAGTPGVPVQNMPAPRPERPPLPAKTCHQSHTLPLPVVGGGVVNLPVPLAAAVWEGWEEGTELRGVE